MGKIIRLIIQGLLIVLVIGCSTSKHTLSFKSQKKKIDTLTIIKPYVIVTSDDKKAQSIDTNITKANEELLAKTTLDLLARKYILKQIDYIKFNKDSLVQLCIRLENSRKILNEVSIGSMLKQAKQTSDNQFGLVLFFRGEFSPKFDPYYNMKVGAATNTIYFNSSTKPYSDLILMIVDLKKMEVVYFNRSSSSNYDPRLPEQIKEMTMKVLRPIYYK